MMRATIPADELFSKARSIGQYYGFVPLTVLTERTRGAPKVKSENDPTAGLSLDPNAEVVASFLKHLRSIGVAPTARQPLFIWHTNITPGRPVPKRAVIQFHALGADRAIADAVVIRATMALMRDLHRAEPTIRVNSMGDKETRARYARELGAFFKRRGSTLPEECVTCAKEDALAAAELVLARAAADDLPSPTEYLSDASRKRFEDILEYLEMTETPYELARHLISRGGIWNDTCFELTLENERVAWGSRYSELARRYFGGPMPAIGAVVTIPTAGTIAKKPTQHKLRFTFIHIGDEAKRLSIKLAEDFRKAHLPLTQHIGLESLTEQMHVAESHESPYLLIMGRREALENTAILRNRSTQQETTLSLANLIDHLKAVA